jgi:hypothetical protein
MSDAGGDLSNNSLLATIMGIWAPPDMHTAPSKEEVEETKNAITILESRLQVAVGSRWRWRSKVKKLHREIEQLKAWIAPIRRIPYDILSLIFLQTCQADFKAPFTLGAVCTVWRRSLLETPRAWTFVQIQHLKNLDTIQVVLNRSVPYPLYIDAPSKSHARLTLALEGHTERIECLRMNSIFFQLLRNPFSNLTKLAVTGENTSGAIRDPDILDGSKFPKLRCLHTNFLLDSMSEMVPPRSFFPPIEELTVSTQDPRCIAKIIEQLAPKLTLLYIVLLQPGYSAEHDEPIEILFPRLHGLTILHPPSWTDTRLWPFHARTPVLRSYGQKPVSPGHNIHEDTQTVTHLGFGGRIDFQPFPRIQEVFSQPEGIHELLDKLEEDPQRWPDVKMLHCKYQAGIIERIDAFNIKHGRNIRCIMTEPGPAFLIASFQSTWPLHCWSCLTSMQPG